MLGGYEILARIRAGSMGTLYLGRRAGPRGFTRPVAIKVIHDHLASSERFRRMFEAEAKLAARIDDPHVVRVEELGEEEGRYFLVMEYVHGVSLAQALAVLKGRGGIPIEIAVAIGMQIAAGLHGAHEATDEDGRPLNIVHRDVSPHNIVVSYRGHVRLIDFGIAKARQQGETQTGSLRGKLSYMPPEQARSARTVDRRADVYAAGLILWEMLTGRRYLTAPTDLALLALLKDPPSLPPSSVNAAVPPALDAVVMKTLSLAPDARPQTAADLQRLLGEALPAALKVLPADVAVVMDRVRKAATKEKPEDDAEVYVEEVRTGLTVFGKSLREKSIDDDTAPMIRESTPSSLGGLPSIMVEDEMTRKQAVPTPRRLAFARIDRTVKLDRSPLPFALPSREIMLFAAGALMLFVSVTVLAASCLMRTPARAVPATTAEP